MAKKLKDDDIQLNISVGTNEAQESIRKLGDETAKLQARNKELHTIMAQLEGQSLKNTDTYKAMRAELKSNNERIKANKEEVDKLTSTLTTNQKTMAQLLKTAKELSAQMDKLVPGTEEWEKLNKQYQEVRDRMSQIKSATFDVRGVISKFADTVNRYWSVIAAGAAAIVSGVKGITGAFKDVINSNQSAADSWNRMIAGMKSGWDYFMQSISTGDFSNFFSNMNKAIKAGKDFADTMTETNREIRALKFQQNEEQRIVAELKAEMEAYGTTAARKLEIEAEMRDLNNTILARELDIRQRQYDATLEFVANKAKIEDDESKKELERFIQEYGNNKELLKQAKEYNAVIAKAQTAREVKEYKPDANGGYMGIGFEPDYALISKINRETDEVVKNFAELLKSYLNLKAEHIDQLLDVQTNLTQAQTKNAQKEEEYNKLYKKLLKDRTKSDSDRLKELETLQETSYQDRLLGLKEFRKGAEQTDAEYQEQATKAELDAHNLRIKGYENFLSTVTDPKLYKEVEKKIAAQRTSMLDAERAFEQTQLNFLQETGDKQLRVAQNGYDEDKAELDKALAQKRKTQDQYDMELLVLDAALATNRLSVQKNFLSDIEDLELQNGDLKAKAVEEANKVVMAADVKAAQDRAALLRTIAESVKDFSKQFGLVTPEQETEARLKVLNDAYQARKELLIANGEDITALTAAYEQARTNILRDAEQQRHNIRKQLGITTRKEDYDAELEQLQSKLDAEFITEEDYQKALLDLRVGYLKKYFDYYSNLFSGSITALQDAEIANIEAKYDAEIAAAGDNAEQVEKLETEKAQKTLDVQKKYADVNFAIKAAQIIADTAVGIMAAFQLGPIAGAIAAALIGITGAAQLAAANAERKKVKAMTLAGSGSSSGGQRVVTTNGFADAGYTGDGDRYEPAGIVHRGEYVVGVPEMKQPTVMRHVRAIERVRRRRTSVNPLPGFADAGYVSGSKQPAATPGDVDAELKAMIVQNNTFLRYLIDNPLKAYTVLSELEATQSLKNTTQDLGTR